MTSEADELIARLAAEGELEGHGGFSLDPERALEKLREYQLADPTRFVLSWVRAANYLGATRIDVEIDADDVWFRFDGELLEVDEFDALWSAVVGFTARSDPRVLALRELALGINGAFAWKAKRVSIQVGERLFEFDRDFTMTRSTVGEGHPGPFLGTRIHAKRPLAWELLRRAALDARGELPEELVLASACVRGRVPLILEGRRLNPPLAEPEGLRYRLRISQDDRAGVLWLRPPAAKGASSVAYVLKAGVAAATLQLAYGDGWIEAIVDDTRLPLDLSQDKLVEGPRYESLLACLSRARWHAYFAAMQLEHVEHAERRRELEAIIVRDILACPDLSWLDAPGTFEFANTIVLPRAVIDPCGGFRTLVRAKLEPPSPPRPRPQPGPLTLGDLVRFARREGTIYRRGSLDPELPFVESLPVLQAKVSPQTQALGETLLVGLGRARYWAAVRALASPETWPLPEDWLQIEHRRAELHVRLAWRRGIEDEQAGALILCREGRRLGEYLLPPSWGPLWIEVDGPLEIEIASSGELVPERELATVVLTALEAYAELIARLDGARLGELERALVRDYLREAWGRWSARRLAELIVIPASARDAAAAAWSGGWGVPDEWAQARAGERGICEHELASLAWLDTGLDPARRFASLRDVQRMLASHGQLDYLPREERPKDASAWHLDSRDRALLTDLFPGSLEPVDLAAAARKRRTGKFAVPEALDQAQICVPIEGPRGERGILGLPRARVPPAWGPAPRRGARVRLGREGHECGFMDLPLPLGPFYGVLEVPALRCAPHTHQAIKDEAWREAAKLVETAARTLAEAQLEAWRRDESMPDSQRLRDWHLDLERGGWPSFAATWREWYVTLGPNLHDQT